MRRWEIAAKILALAVIVGTPVAVFTYDASLHGSRDVREITQIAANGAWSQEELHVQQGETVRLRLSSADVVHGFRVEGYGLETTRVYPGRVSTIEFVADATGTFPFTCTVVCSVEHRHMEGRIVVEGRGVSAEQRGSGQ